MKVIALIMLLCGACVYAQDEVPCAGNVTAWIAPEAMSIMFKTDVLKFWRINMDSAKGDWHLYNEADDKKFLQDVATRIASGQYNHTRLEWTSVVARLPK